MRVLFFFFALVFFTLTVNAQNPIYLQTSVNADSRTNMDMITISVPDNRDTLCHTFVWNTGDTSDQITVPFITDGVEYYSVTITNQYGEEEFLTISSDCFLNMSVTPNEICAGGIANVFVTNNIGSVLPTGGDYTFIWSDGGPNTATRQFSPLVTTTYSVTVTHVSGCGTSMDRTVVVTPSQPVFILGSDSLCVGENAVYYVTDQFGQPISGAQYLWSNNGTQSSTMITAGSSSFSLSVTVTQNGTCTSTTYQGVTVTPKPTLFIETIEAPGQTVLLAHGNGSFLWSNNSTQDYVKVTQPSWLMVTITDANGCTNSANVDVNSIFACPPSEIITVIEYITVTDTDTIYINCGGECVLNTATISQQGECGSVNLEAFSNGIGALLYNWSNGQVTKKITVTQSGDYTVTVTDVAGCTATSSIWVTVNPTATSAFEFSMNKLVGVFTNHSTGPILGYLWSFGDGETSTETNPTHEYQNSGTYPVSLTVYTNCGNFVTTKTITAQCMTLNAYAQDYTVCINQPVKLSASVVEQQFIVWDWQPDANIPNDNTQSEATAFINQNTLFKVTARDIFNGCVATKEFWVFLDCTTANGEPDPHVSVAIYPNPSSDFFRITLTPGQYDVNLTDMEGRSIEGFSVTGDFEIAAHKLPAGIYNLQITGDEFHTTERLVVQR
ncbi:MAG: hypothetical protein QG583_691 [Patescibacteria group bacterium]|nr:hypothetical protein [Patescibacteria group bacterium]